MQDFTARRKQDTADELWLLEHTSVYTQGQAGKPEHLLDAGGIPVVQTDRGGQITWHGPGQMMFYTLLDNRRLHLGARALVDVLEQSLIAVLESMGIASYAKRTAPGVYVKLDGVESKIAALGLRVKKTGCYHGAALNIDCDLVPFLGINPCGYQGQSVTRLTDCSSGLLPRKEITQRFVDHIVQVLNYSQVHRICQHE